MCIVACDHPYFTTKESVAARATYCGHYSSYFAVLYLDVYPIINFFILVLPSFFPHTQHSHLSTPNTHTTSPHPTLTPPPHTQHSHLSTPNTHTTSPHPTLTPPPHPTLTPPPHTQHSHHLPTPNTHTSPHPTLTPPPHTQHSHHLPTPNTHTTSPHPTLTPLHTQHSHHLPTPNTHTSPTQHACVTAMLLTASMCSPPCLPCVSTALTTPWGQCASSAYPSSTKMPPCCWMTPTYA